MTKTDFFSILLGDQIAELRCKEVVDRSRGIICFMQNPDELPLVKGPVNIQSFDSYSDDGQVYLCWTTGRPFKYLLGA